ncbi:MAG: META domain-containing protein, partial [Planctomycetes bacterium]|nr:META domain-containing protein [Planctomycetota bacterium]
PTGDGQLVTWRFGAVDGDVAIGETEITFGPDGSVTGTTGCNRFNGQGAMRDGVLVIGEPLATTRMACPGGALSSQEDHCRPPGPLERCFRPVFPNTSTRQRGRRRHAASRQVA